MNCVQESTLLANQTPAGSVGLKHADELHSSRLQIAVGGCTDLDLKRFMIISKLKSAICFTTQSVEQLGGAAW